MKKLVIVEDDKRLAELIGAYLSRSGFHVTPFINGYSAIEHCRKYPPDIIILDLNLPDIDGISICNKLRNFYTGKILILTASSNDLDQIDGFETGADDFVTKPVEPRVLLARINALLNRDQRAINNKSEKIVFGNLTIDEQSRTVNYKDSNITLTSNEFELLMLFCKKPGVILSRDEIFTSMKRIEYDGIDRAVDIKISRLRKKLGDIASKPTKIKTIWGKGYLFVASAWEDE